MHLNTCVNSESKKFAYSDKKNSSSDMYIFSFIDQLIRFFCWVLFLQHIPGSTHVSLLIKESDIYTQHINITLH